MKVNLTFAGGTVASNRVISDCTLLAAFSFGAPAHLKSRQRPSFPVANGMTAGTSNLKSRSSCVGAVLIGPIPSRAIHAAKEGALAGCHLFQASASQFIAEKPARANRVLQSAFSLWIKGIDSCLSMARATA